jgi:mono/diheme cytochrome c family protein
MKLNRTSRFAILLAGALVAGWLGSARADSRSTDAEEKALFRQGAQLWPQYCGNCHKPRPGGERSAAEWETIMLHMRTVANLPAANARAIQVFLGAH